MSDVFEEDSRPRSQRQAIATAELVEDQRLRPRERLSPSWVSECADLLHEGVKFPAITVALVDSRYLIVDGYHRYEASKLVGIEVMECDVHRVDWREAILLSAEANKAHGLNRTREDRRRSVAKLLSDPDWVQWSDREIAKRCGVRHPLVAEMRTELGLLTGISSTERTFVTKHGTVSTMRIRSPRLLKTEAATIASIQSPVILTEPIPAAKIDYSHVMRERFLAAVKDMELIEVSLPATTAARSDPASDALLAARLTKLARKLSARADLLATTLV